MKNFPHQINQIDKLVRALEVIRDLIQNRENVLDDGVLGYALAREQVYTFRNYNPMEMELEERICREQMKPLGNQGARTCARDLRRLFELLGFISITNGVVQISDLGIHAINAGSNLEEAQVGNVWRGALENMVVFSENGQGSHPYRILLRLVSEFNNGIPSRKLALALEADNDSEEEFQRILQIASQEEGWEEALDGVSENQLKNGSKILPALARQINDIREEQRLNYINGNQNNNELEQSRGIATDSQVTTRRGRNVRYVNSHQIAAIPTRQDDDSQEDNTVDLTGAIRIRHERFERHQELVRFIAAQLESLNYHLYEDPMDCLAVNEEYAALIEVKTLNGQYDDERKQVRLALGQLLYYEMININDMVHNQNVYKIALFESKISNEHIRYFESNNCFVLWINDNELQGTQNSINLMRLLGII